ncbi:MAG: ABC transporter ATP-binding protein [Gammaproteobacteria bacterium]|nr:ABC transporter ATP-binding protein [Gammaproteobacteria bacterium]
MVVNALKITDLRKTYKSGPQALCGIDLAVEEGDFFALLGPNGAGKSTAIGIISSLINKSYGQVEVFGHDLDREPEMVKSCIGLVPQEFNFNQFLPTEEVVANQAGYYGIPRAQAMHNAEESLRQLDLWPKRKVMARELSGGMKRRLMIARALVHRPRLLILDEPTAGVDIEIRRSMWAFLQELNRSGTTIILTTHYLEEAENLCRNIAIINHGSIVEHSSMDALLAKLHTETFVLTLRDRLEQLPTLDGFAISQRDGRTLEVSVERERGINGLFAGLSQQGIEVLSLRNKQNRLEQLFIDMLDAARNGENP